MDGEEHVAAVELSLQITYSFVSSVVRRYVLSVII